jgi:hypothetical protein
VSRAAAQGPAAAPGTRGLARLRAGLRKRIHVVGQHVRHNKPLGRSDRPSFTVQTSGGAAWGHGLVLRDAAGAVVARFRACYDRPLANGAVVYLETTLAVEVEA